MFSLKYHVLQLSLTAWPRTPEKASPKETSRPLSVHRCWNHSQRCRYWKEMGCPWTTLQLYYPHEASCQLIGRATYPSQPARKALIQKSERLTYFTTSCQLFSQHSFTRFNITNRIQFFHVTFVWCFRRNNRICLLTIIRVKSTQGVRLTTLDGKTLSVRYIFTSRGQFE